MQLLKGATGLTSALHSCVQAVVKSRRQHLATESLRQGQAVDKKRHARTWTPEETAELIRLRSSGVSYEHLASHSPLSGRSYKSIAEKCYKLVKDHRLPPSTKRAHVSRHNKLADIVALRHSGYTYQAIAEKLGVPSTSLVRTMYLSRPNASANTSTPKHAGGARWSHEEDTLLRKLRCDGLTDRALVPHFPHRSLRAITQRARLLHPSARAKPTRLAEPTRLGPWSEDEDTQLETLFLQGKRVSFIAKELRRAVKHVYARIWKQRLVRPRDMQPQEGITLPSPGSSLRWSISEMETLKQGIKQNWTVPHLAQHLNRSRSAVNSKIKNLNLTVMVQHAYTLGLPERTAPQLRLLRSGNLGTALSMVQTYDLQRSPFCFVCFDHSFNEMGHSNSKPIRNLSAKAIKSETCAQIQLNRRVIPKEAGSPICRRLLSNPPPVRDGYHSAH
ncbi:hypothetical protein AC578_3674 [Pseudocercospora eumusae]|uniref:Myb-like domain-containing protein n=1 Tax=Pseudocercospora eumusae TaxID=321146 RepID=A0A139HSR2_9PEZI|nr:hypothetical protein AC578_3674 [Pseudocercospora eumusae]